MRLDLFLVQKKGVSSRTQAQELIRSGQVHQLRGGRKIPLTKPNHEVSGDGADIFIESGPANRFVSRGGLKLEGALEQLRLEVTGKTCLDVGLSTGGFTDCLLQRGASAVVGVDVGHGQTHPRLLQDSRLKVLEGINARELASSPQLRAVAPPSGFDLIVMDVSFISIQLVLPQLSAWLKSDGLLLSLVKPQFEVGPEGLGKGGVVKDPGLYSGVEDKVKQSCQAAGFQVQNYFASSIEGKDGNKEFFIFAQKKL